MGLGKAMAECKLAEKDLRIKELTLNTAQQKLAIEALTRFLIEKSLIDQDELDSFIQEVDAEDGIVDGKLSLNSGKRQLVFKKSQQ